MTRVLLILVAFAFMLAERAQAATISWLSPAAGTFSNGANWVLGNPPGPLDTAQFGATGGGSPFIVTFDSSVTNSQLLVRNQQPIFSLPGGVIYTLTGDLRVQRIVFPAALTVSQGTVRCNQLLVAEAFGTGELNIDGATARLEVTTGMHLGLASAATLRILNGGVLTCAGGNLGSGDTPSQILLSGAGSSWTDPGTFFRPFLVGEGGQGHPLCQLRIEDGAELSVSQLNTGAVGTGTGASGDVVVTGPSSQWTNGGDLVIGAGNNANASVSVENGALLSCRNCGVANTGGSMGLLTITGAGSRLVAQESVYVGVSLGDGDLVIADGGEVEAPGVAIFLTGELRGNGTIIGTLGSSGTVRPGLSAGVLTINGDAYVDVGQLIVEIGGTAPGSEHDQLVVTGLATLGADLEIELINGFVPSHGQSFSVLQCGSRDGQFQTITGADLGGGLILAPQYSPTGVTLVAQQITGIAISPDPANVYLGFTAQASLAADVQGGGSLDATGAAAWSVDNPTIASVSSSGLISAQAVGSTTVRANFAGLDAEAPLNVLALPAQLATDRVSLDSNENQGNAISDLASISGNGRIVAFRSDATNLVPGDTNGTGDVFVRDLVTGTTTRVSVATGGAQANGPSFFPDISFNGRFVAYYSSASNLVGGDTNGVADVFVHDRETGETSRVNLSTAGAQDNAGVPTGLRPSLSADGDLVLFESYGTNLVAADTNGFLDVFVRDRQAGTTVRVSVSTGGDQANDQSQSGGISADGRWVAITSFASNLVGGDSNGTWDAFIHDRQTGQTTRESVDSSGMEGNGISTFYLRATSGNGRFVCFQSFASNLVPGDANGLRDIFLRDRQAGTTVRVNVGPGGVEDNGGVGSSTISNDGRFVAFRSFGNNLVAGDTNGVDDVFIYNRLTEQLTRESLSFFGAQSNGLSQFTTLSSDGRHLVFFSDANNLAPFDTNGVRDVFLRSRALDGDLNCDGLTSLLDTDAFVQALLDPDGYSASYPSCFISTADMNGDGTVDGIDVQYFVDALLGG